MDNSVNPTDNVSNNDDFWEKASIELDIAIDEQDEGKCDEIVEIPAGDLKSILNLDIKDKDGKRFWELITNKEGDVKIETKIYDKKSEDKFWTAFFLAKKLRAKLQSEKNDKQSKKLDWVVDLLIKKAASLISEDKPFQYLLLMLELAACTIGEQSLGFSQKAKEILLSEGKFPKNGKFNLYNALIHYNQGVAKAHMGQYHDALREYDDALKEYKKVKGNAKILDVWSEYVYHPTILQKAEVLIKMAFSSNALKTLEEIKADGKNPSPSSFHKARKELLKAACYIELEHWKKFKEHFEKEIDKCSKKGKKYFQESSLGSPEPFLNATKPQKSKSGVLPSLLASSYNSLVLDGAKKDLKDRIDRIIFNSGAIAGLDCLGIFDFLSEYMNQCQHNRFDRLTLKETILDYIKILGELVKRRKNTFEAKPGPARSSIEKLRGLLGSGYNLIEEIDSYEKPPFHPDSVKKAKNVLEEINDEILKQWFDEKNSATALPSDLWQSFEFEGKLIDKLLNLEKRPDLLPKEYDKRSLNVRKQLLTVISKKSYDHKNLKKLRYNLVCVCGNDKNDQILKNGTTCLKHFLPVLEATGVDTEPDNGRGLYVGDYDKILKRESLRFRKHLTGRSMHPLPLREDQRRGGGKDKYSVNYVGLRRWNSYTPELSFSVGGGHFVFLSKNEGMDKDKGKIRVGIAVDPGFDFIRNFFRQGFTLTDIDIVLLTHAHPDHIRDFPAIVELLLESRKRLLRQEKKICAVMSLGCYQRLDDYIAFDPFKLLFYDTIIVDIDEDKDNEIKFSYNDKDGDENRPIQLISPDDKKKSKDDQERLISLGIRFFKSFHDDHSESDSYGYIIEFKDSRGNTATIGFTGDSKWFPKYAEKFNKCDMICSHIGSIAEPERDKFLKDYDSIGKAERLMRTKNHPYLFGEILFLQDWKKELSKNTLVLISEFGEEMKGQIRSDLTKRLNRPRKESGCWSDFGPTDSKSLTGKCKNKKNCKEKYAANVFTIPVDVGLRISVPLENGKKKKGREYNNRGLPGKVHCVVCDEFVRPDRIDYEVYSHEEAIFYVCETCRRSVSLDVLLATYQKYHEKGREIEKYEISP